MLAKPQQMSTNSLTSNPGETVVVERHPSEPPGLRGQIEQFLQAGQPKKALDVLARTKVQSPWSTNAIAVCLLRLGQTDRAIELFRSLVLSGSLFLRRDVPTAWKANFATALLMANNLFGCIQVLRDIQDEHDPNVQRLRGVIRRWQRELSMAEKFQWFLGGQPARPVVLDFLPGEL